MLLRSVGVSTREHDSAESFLALADLSAPCVLITDVRMPGMSGIQLLEQLKKVGADVQAIIVTAYGDMEGAVRAMRAGAIQCLPKPFRDQALLDAVNEAIRVNDDRRKSRSASQLREERLRMLTPREHEILGQVVAGSTSAKIAESLGISRKTVEVHRTNLMRKLGVRSAVELVRVASSASMERNQS